MKIGILDNQDSPATCLYRTTGVFNRLSKTHPRYETQVIQPGAQWGDYQRNDVVVFQRPNGEQMLSMIQDCKRMGVKVILDHDDLLTNVTATNPAAAHYNSENIKKTIEQCFQYADAVIVSTPVLKQEFEKWHKNIHVIPNGVDLTVTPFTTPIKSNPAARIAKEPKKTKENHINPEALLKVLWRGSMTHMEDLKTIESFWIWAGQHEVVNVGWIGIMPAYVATHYPGILTRDWRPFVFHYFEELRNAGADYGVFPLVNNPFNQAKSNIFAMEMLCAGVVPYVPVGFPEFDHPGVRHFQNSGELIKEFYELLKDDPNYTKTIEDGREWIMQERDIDKLNLKRIEILENL